MKIIKLLALLGTLLFAQILYAGSPVGTWRTIDDVTGKQKAVVQISQSGGTLSGYIVTFTPSPGKTIDEVCDKCSGSKKNQPIKGMTIMWGLTQDPSNPNAWTGGQILDPKIGKVYRCKIELVGNTLKVRGYVGISLLGRTQTWYRMR